MRLSDSRVGAAIAVTDMPRAIEFYEGKLGLSAPNGDDADGGRTYQCGQGSVIHVFPSSNAQASGATVAGFTVGDVDGTVDELIAQGVAFEQYSEPFATDARGVATLGDTVGAWFKDPDGNVLSLGNR
jgi:catechol 2,3-dioxygenase-like lactoylglutathione lyase family enzyme